MDEKSKDIKDIMDEKAFGAEYKRVFDGIHASDALRERIMAQGAQSVSRNIKKTAFYTRMRPYIAAATAAAAGLAIFAAVHDRDLNRRDDGVISETRIAATEPPSGAVYPDVAADGAGAPVQSAEQASEAAKPENASGSGGAKTTEELQREALERYGVTSEPPATAKPAAKTAPDNSEQQSGGSYSWSFGGTAETTDAPAEQTEPSQPPTEQQTESASMTRSIEPPAAVRGVTLSMNSPSVYAIYENAAVTAAVYDTAEPEQGEIAYEVWDNERYAEYLGADVTEKASLPSDMVYIGAEESGFMVDESGAPVNDSRIYAFEGDNGRYASIVTSRDTVYAEAYLSEPELAKSDVNGTEAVVFDMGNGAYKSYMVYDEVSYITDTEGLDETELSELMGSLAE